MGLRVNLKRWLTLLFYGLAAVYCAKNEYVFLYILYSILIWILIKFLFKPVVSIFLKFIVIFFILGNWLKITIHGIFDYPYVEATGNFVGAEEQWNDFFLNSLVIASALIIGIVFYINSPRIKGWNAPLSSRIGFRKFRSKIFPYILLCLVLLIYILNWAYGFYRIGVARELNLPFGLDAPASFMVYLFAPMLYAIWVNNRVLKSGFVTPFSLIVTSAVFIIAATVTYSRATIVIVMIPIILGMHKTSYQVSRVSQPFAGSFSIVALSIIISLISVSVVRIVVYGGAGVVDSVAFQYYLSESIGLVFDRWVGAEGLMTAVASNPTIELFFRMLFEDPTVGVNGIYQYLSGSQYYSINFGNMTFLTLPGVFALLAFSGNLFVLFFGVFIVIAIGVFIEQFVAKSFPMQYPLHYLVSATMAYNFSQMIFPLLLIPLVVQIGFFILILKIFYNHLTRRLRF